MTSSFDFHSTKDTGSKTEIIQFVNPHEIDTDIVLENLWARCDKKALIHPPTYEIADVFNAIKSSMAAEFRLFIWVAHELIAFSV